MTQIQRLVVDEQSMHDENEGVGCEGFANGIGRVRLEEEVGWEERRVWE
jgi:hypothetical protein